MATILVALDGSDIAHEAASAALDLLGPTHTWELLAVVSPHDQPDSGVIGRIDRPTLAPEVIDQHRRQAQADALEVGRALDMDGEVRVETGEPGPVICRTADDLAVDLVVVGSHGRGSVGRALLGSVSRYVLEHASCPVFVHRAHDDG
jgi:nucleotide-binding universal stress UspA family protein